MSCAVIRSAAPHQAIGEVRVLGIGAQVRERQHRPESVRRHLGQRALDGPSHRSRHARAKHGQRRHRSEDLLRQHGEHIRSAEGRLTRQQLVEHAGQAVLVCPRVHLAVASGLLGTHVGGGPHAEAGLGQPVAGRDARGARDAEVRDQRVALGEQDVLRLHVAMDQPLGVGIVERFPRLPHQAQCFGQGERALAGKPLAQRLTLHVRHDVERPGLALVGGAGVEQGEDVGVLEPRQDLDLAQEALASLAADDLGVQDLDRHEAVVLAVARGRPSPCRPGPARVRPRSGRLGSRGRLGHGGAACLKANPAATPD